MSKITWFREYLLEIQTAVDGINSNRVVIDDSMLTKFLEAVSSDKNLMLIGVLPDFGSNASTADDYLVRASTQLMVLKKTTYSEENYDDFIKIFEDTYVIAELVVKKILTDSMRGCNNLRWLNASSFQIVPVWDKNECNGWNILFNFDLPI